MSDQSDDDPKNLASLAGLKAIQQAAGLNNLGEVGKTVRALAGQVGALQLELGRGLNEALAPILALRNTVVIPPWLDEVTRAHRAIVGPVGNVIAEIQRSMQPGLVKFAKEMADLARVMAARQEAQREAFPILSTRIPMLAQRGWFISYGFGLEDFDSLAETAKSASDDELERLVEDLYRENLVSLVDHFNRSYPARQAIVEQAIYAHREGLYALSIPVFFAQSDGVCMERTKRHFFMGGPDQHVKAVAQEKTSALQAELKNDDEGQQVSKILELLMWAPLLVHHSIRYNNAKREEMGYSGLNRHTVLHGESLDYATEVNSLKAFSLLSYMASLLEQDGDVA